MTHILIPISELSEDGVKFINALSGHTARQISLDEKSINKLAEEKYPQTMFNMGNYKGRKAYKQALKDLL